MTKRTLLELNLLDDFLFNAVLSYPKIGEAFSRELLKVIFQREFGKLAVIPQKVYGGSDTDKHGARLDVYLEENLEAGELVPSTVYDVEPNLNDDKADVKALPKRVRFYHSLIDSKSLQSGAAYQELKNVIVIMITPYDPFGYDQMIYTISNRIKELPDERYEDGAKTIFLYTKGTKGNVSEELRQFLQYMEHTTLENARNENLKKIHGMIEKVKHDEEVSIECMKIFERERMLIKQGIRQGIEQGRKMAQEELEQERVAKEQACVEKEQACVEKEQAQKRAENERGRAEEAEKEVERLRKKLQKLQAQKL